MEIDLLVIKKLSAQSITHDIGSFFRKHNLVEYKSPDDALNIDVFYKALGYACLYKSFGKTVNDIPAEEITLTLVRQAPPVKLFHTLTAQGLSVCESSSGIYRISGSLFPVQLIVGQKLDFDAHTWLAALMENLSLSQMKAVLQKASELASGAPSSEKSSLGTSLGKYGQTLAESALDVIIKVNPSAYANVLKEEQSMNDIIRKQFHVDELEQALIEKDKRIVERDKTIHSFERTIAEQNQLIAKLRAQLAQAGVK